MQVVKWVSVGLVSLGLGACSSFASEPLDAGGKISEPAGATANPQATAENTGQNKRDRENATLTPGDQGNSKADREMTAKIRRAVVKDKQLSTTAKNIKIITIDGKVTLRGPVKNPQERSIINGIAQKASPSSLDNQLEVEK
jgi:hyperosmotically inducible protein